MQKLWIWPFELEEKIGEGGMGVVYRGRYVKNDRRVAVKLLPSHISADNTLVARFERELEVLKKLRHPHIVHCFGGVCEDKQRFYAMQLVEGGSIEGLLQQRGRLPWELVAEYAVQLCQALACAHQHNVIHRDVKPANLLLTKSGKLKLSDFGLASIAIGNKLTADDKTLGTFHYMAPEQIRGKPPLSPQTDLYALGCVLFEMVVGRPPFTGDAPAEILHQHVSRKPPRISTFVPDCPTELDSLILELLEKDPQQRPFDADTVARRIRNLSHTITVKGPLSDYQLDDSSDPVPASESKISPPDSYSQISSKTSLPAWLLPACWVLLISLIFWNFSLIQENRRLSHSQEMWIEALRNPDEQVREQALNAIEPLQPFSEEIIQKIMKGLSHKDPKIRQTAAKALGNMGATARTATTPLLKVTQTDDRSDVRHQARQALEKIRNAPEPGFFSSYGTTLVLTLCLIAGAWVIHKWQQI